jgi:hypothetical protein
MNYLTLLSSLLLLSASSVAHADPPDRKARSGWHVGFGIGGGQMSCESVEGICEATLDEAGGVDVHVGKLLSPRFSLEGEIWAMFHSEDRVTVSHTITTFGARYWLAPRLWVKGGIGGAVARASYKGPLVRVSDETDTVPGIQVGVGYELMVGDSFALDLQGKAGTGFYDDDQVRAHNASLTVGFNWY